MKNKKKGTIAAVLAAALAAALFVSGCSPFKPSLLSLANSTVKNVGKAESAAVTMNLNSEFALKQTDFGIEADIQLDIASDMEVTKNPQLTKGTADIEVGVLGQKQPVKMDFYVDNADDGTATTYSRIEKGRWTKKVLKTKGEGQTDSLNNPLLVSGGLVKLMMENPMGAELHEETTSVNGKDAYRITMTVPGDMVKTILETLSEDKEEEKLIDLNELDWDAITLPGEIDIYKDSKLPARIYVDLQSAGVQLTSLLLSKLTGENGALPLDSLTLEVEKCTLELIFDRYGEIEPIEIPQEVLDAKEESEDSGFSITDFFK